MDDNNNNQTRLKTVSYDKISIHKRNSNLRQLQLNILDSLTKGQTVKIKKPLRKSINKSNDNDYELYNSKINSSLNKYQLSIIQDKEKDEEVDPNDLGPNEKYLDKDDKRLILKLL